MSNLTFPSCPPSILVLSKAILLLWLFGFYESANSSDRLQELQVPSGLWEMLGSTEKSQAASRFRVEIVDTQALGTIIDVQVVNESTDATTGGAALGSAYGQASYIDKSFDNGDYSARGQLGAALVGSALGSLLDTPASQKHRFRYAIQNAQGLIMYLEETSNQSFTHPKGICVKSSPIEPLPQHICSLTVSDLRAFIADPSLVAGLNTQNSVAKRVVEPARVRCETNSGSVALLSEQMCKRLGGNIL